MPSHAFSAQGGGKIIQLSPNEYARIKIDCAQRQCFGILSNPHPEVPLSVSLLRHLLPSVPPFQSLELTILYESGKHYLDIEGTIIFESRILISSSSFVKSEARAHLCLRAI